MTSIHERIIAGKTGKPITPTSFQELFRDNWKALDAAIETEEGSLTHFEVSYLTSLLGFYPSPGTQAFLHYWWTSCTDLNCIGFQVLC